MPRGSGRARAATRRLRGRRPIPRRTGPASAGAAVRRAAAAPGADRERGSGRSLLGRAVLAARLGPLFCSFLMSSGDGGPGAAVSGERFAAVDVQGLAGEEGAGHCEQDAAGDVVGGADATGPAARAYAGVAVAL